MGSARVACASAVHSTFSTNGPLGSTTITNNSTFSTNGPLSSTTITNSSSTRPMYGLSQVFEVPTPTTLVSNTHLSATDFFSVSFLAQSFETGANAGGYTVSEVDIRFADVIGRSTTVKIRENNADNRPGDLVTTLTDPGTLTADSLNTFTAPVGTTLDASKTYWLTVNEGISSNRVPAIAIQANDETGETGWSIGDGSLWRGGETDSWSDSITSLLITIKGTAIPTTTLVSNTHLSSTGSSSGIEAQSFETGANLDGYTVSEVDIRFAETSGKSTTVKIRKNNADNEPGDLVATLTNPASLTADSLNTFTAQDVITLAASTTYWLTVNEEISFGRAQVSPASENDETGETGWSIGDSRLFRTDETASWLTATYSLLMTIKGTVPCDGIWCATLTVQDFRSSVRGCDNVSTGNKCTDHLSDDDFTHAMTDYSVDKLYVQSDGQLQLWLQPVIATGSQSLVLHVGSETFAFKDADIQGVTNRVWNNSGLSWTTGDAIGLKLTDSHANATGNPTISGVPQVGMELTADTSAIDDVDGLPATFTYQWVRVDTDGTETDVGTNSTHTVSSSDVDSTIRVDVSFTDLAGNSEGPLPSEATAAVVPAAGLCPAGNDWCATMTVGTYESSGTFVWILRKVQYGQLDETTIDYGPSFEVEEIYIFEPEGSN